MNQNDDKDKRYDFTRTDKDEIKDIEKKVDEKFESKKTSDKIIDIKKLDEDNPMERAIKFDYVKRNPPKPGFMEVEVHEAKDDEGNRFVVSESEQEETKIRMVHDPFRVVDLNTSIMADVTRCPSHVMPQLIDEYVEINMTEKKEFKPEKPKEEFRYWWLLILILMLPGVILLILWFVAR